MPGKNSLIFLVLALISSGCFVNRFYTPAATALPAFRESQDAFIGGGGCSGKGFQGWEANVRYSPVKHVAVMADYFKLKYSGNEMTGYFYSHPFLDYDGKSKAWNIGLGGYTTSTFSDMKLLPSIFLGYGEGSVANRYYRPDDHAAMDGSWKYARWFAQAACAIHQKHLYFGPTLRFSWTNFIQGEIATVIGGSEADRLHRAETESPLFTTELGMTGGINWHICNLSLNFTNILSTKPEYNFFGLGSRRLSLTAGFNLQALWRKD